MSLKSPTFERHRSKVASKIKASRPLCALLRVASLPRRKPVWIPQVMRFYGWLDRTLLSFDSKGMNRSLGYDSSTWGCGFDFLRWKPARLEARSSYRLSSSLHCSRQLPYACPIRVLTAQSLANRGAGLLHRGWPSYWLYSIHGAFPFVQGRFQCSFQWLRVASSVISQPTRRDMCSATRQVACSLGTRS